jgi:hypothetical protein
MDGLLVGVRGEGASIRVLDATWDSAAGPAGLTAALDRLARDAVARSRGGATIVLVTDRA